MHSISIGDVPARQRMDYLHDFVSARIAGLCFEPRDVESFDYALQVKEVSPGLLVSATRYSAVSARRRAGMVAGRSPAYVLSIHDTDYEMQAGGRSWAIRAGDVVVVDEGDPYGFALPGTQALIMALDRATIEELAPGIASAPAHHFDGASSAAALVSGYAALLRKVPLGDQAMLASQQMYDLVAALIGREARSEHGGRAVSQARLGLIKREIDRLATDPALTIDRLARLQGVSPRYIQQLFAREETNFSDYLRHRRLEHARHALEDPARLGHGIAAIAFDAGFGDLSSFNRAFRKAFGLKPSDIRAATLRRRVQ